jgi:hypothetical protein
MGEAAQAAKARRNDDALAAGGPLARLVASSQPEVESYYKQAGAELGPSRLDDLRRHLGDAPAPLGDDLAAHCAALLRHLVASGRIFQTRSGGVGCYLGDGIELTLG